ncbi:MAG: RNA polymerase sigma factor [Lachnospiraceae bacterium]|nr:RNA polymerase sigma factor [Lachnospiraceae bacterium]
MNVNLDFISCAMNNDKYAFEKVYQSIYTDLLKMAIYILGNSDEAEDVVSDTIMDAYTGISKLKDATKFECWILRILSVKCKRKIRDKYQMINVHNPNVSNIDDINIGSYKSDIDNRLDIHNAMMKLKKEERIIVTLCVVEGYKSSDVSLILGINQSTVRSKLNRALAKMRKTLEV